MVLAGGLRLGGRPRRYAAGVDRLRQRLRHDELLRRPRAASAPWPWARPQRLKALGASTTAVSTSRP